MHDHEKEPIGHALHVLDTTMRRYIDTYSHKKEHENLTGTNTWVIQFIADHKDGPVYLRDIERRFGITRSTASKVVDMLVRNGFVERHRKRIPYWPWSPSAVRSPSRSSSRF